MKRKAVIVKFLDGDIPLYKKKKYYYYITDSVLQTLIQEFVKVTGKKSTFDKTAFPVFRIQNENCYNYRDSEVIILGMKDIDDSLDTSAKDILTIVKITPIKKNGMRGEDTKLIYLENKEISSEEEKSYETLLDLSMSESSKGYNKLDNNCKEERKDNMFNSLMKDVKFGITNDVRMSIYGPAFASSDKSWFAYDEKAETFVDVTDFLLDIGLSCFYMMPVGKNEVNLGDFIYHQNKWVRIIDVDDGGRLVVENIFTREVATILPTKNMFGFDFYTKLISIGDSLFGGIVADEKNPFGNILPFLFLSGNNSGENNLLPLLLMNNGIFKENPMMMYLLMSGDKNNNTLPLAMMLMNKKEE